jgi:hypothetical protein
MYKFIPTAVSLRAGRALLYTQKHSPTILFAAGVVGVAGTVVLACKATLKVEEILEDAQKKSLDIKTVQHATYTEQDRKQDLAIHYTQTTLKLAKLYAPSIAVGVLSIAALTGSHHILSKRNAALTAAYSTLQKGFDEYRKRVRDELGEEKDLEFRHGKQKISEVDPETGKKVARTGPADDPSIYARFFDQTNPRWEGGPGYNVHFLKNCQNWCNDMLRARGHLFLSEVYDHLCIDRTPESTVVGWLWGKGGDDYVDFGMFDGNGQAKRDFINGREGAILLDFNVDGVIWDKI